MIKRECVSFLYYALQNGVLGEESNVEHERQNGYVDEVL